MSTISLSPLFNGWQGFLANGNVNAGGYIWTYIAGTTTQAVTYTTQAGSTPLPNPIPLNAGGFPSTAGGNVTEIWVLNNQNYKFSIFDSLNNPLPSYDNITPMASQSDLSASAGLGPATFASLGSLAPINGLGTIVNLQGHTVAGIGGGQFIAKAGSVTNDGGTQINSATGGLYWQRMVLHDIYDLWMFGATGVKAADEAAAALAITAIKANARGTLVIPSKISSTAVIPLWNFSNSQSGNMIDLRTDNPAYFGQEVHRMEGRDASGGYASEFRIQGKQQPSFSLQSLSDGTAFGYRSGIPNNMTGVNSFKANGDALFQWLTDPLACGVVGDMGILQYAQGPFNVQFAGYIGVDGNNKSRWDIAPAQFVQTTLAITAVSNTTPIVITLASPHGIIPTRSYVTISGTGFATVDGSWRVIVSGANQLTLLNSVAAGVGATGSCIFQINVQRASLNVPKAQGLTEAIVGEGKVVATGANGQLVSEIPNGTPPVITSSQTVDTTFHARPYVMNTAGTQAVSGTPGSGGAKIVKGVVTLSAGTATVTLTNDAIFTNNSTFNIGAVNLTNANAFKAVKTSGSSITFTGTGTDQIDFLMIGF